MVEFRVLLLLALLLLESECGADQRGAKVLVVPFHHFFNSRLMNMESLAEVLVDAGYDVTMVLNNRTTRQVHSPQFRREIFDVPDTLRSFDSDDLANKLMEHDEKGPAETYNIFYAQILVPWCERLLSDLKLMRRLKQSSYQLVIFDFTDDCNRILVDYLDIPAIAYSNYGFTSNANVFFPTVPSFTPFPESRYFLSDNMSFLTRLNNHFAYAVAQLVVYPWVSSDFDKLRKKLHYNDSLPVDRSYDRCIVLATINFALDFPRPLMPHIIPLPGLLREPPSQLEEEWRQWMDEANEGVIVVSFGTVINDWTLPKRVRAAEILSRVFGRLRERVIWRMLVKPKALSSNIRVVKWMPQNALLAHRNTRAFVTHAGISATYEAVNNSVPVLCFPIFVDQHRNSAFMVERNEMGLRLDFDTFNEQEMEESLRRVLNESHFRRNALRASKRLRDTPMNARQTLLWWVAYVIRHSGASHLTDTPARTLSLLQYSGADVIAVFILILLVVILMVLTLLTLTFKFCKRSWRRLIAVGKPEKPKKA